MGKNIIKTKPKNKMNIPLSILAPCGPLPKMTKYRRLSSSGLSQQQLPLILHADPSRVYIIDFMGAILRYVTATERFDWPATGYVVEMRADNRWRVTHPGVFWKWGRWLLEPSRHTDGTEPGRLRETTSFYGAKLLRGRSRNQERKKKEEGEGASGFSFRLSCASFIQWLYCFCAFNEVELCRGWWFLRSFLS